VGCGKGKATGWRHFGIVGKYTRRHPLDRTRTKKVWISVDDAFFACHGVVHKNGLWKGTDRKLS
jgi:hypothetical protein